MTKRNISSRPMKRLSHTAAGCLSIFFFLLFLRSPETAAEYIRKGLHLCAETVIPSLFPFMVIAEMIVASGIGDTISRPLAGVMKRLFHLSAPSACAFVLGALCGFPVGARTAVSLYDRGDIDRNELERLLCFCNNTGVAFVISTVGTAIWSSRSFGIGLYCIQLFTALLIAFIRFRNTPPPAARTVSSSRREGISFPSVPQAVTSSARGMLWVCAYICFFSALVGAIGSVLNRFSFPPLISTILFSFFELSSGVSYAASAENILPGVLLTAFAVGWSGLSVHFQIMSICEGRGLSFRPYLSAKAAQGVLCTGLTALWFAVSPPPDITPSASPVLYAQLPTPGLYFILFLFAASLVFSVLRPLFKINIRKNKKIYRNLTKNVI